MWPFSSSKDKPSLDSQVDQIIKENPDINKYISLNPDLKDVLYSHYNRLYGQYKGIIRGAEIVDYWDRILGPIEAGLRWFGPGIGYILSFGLRAIEELVLKIPYSIYYGFKTKDFKGILNYALAETAATVLPYGDILDVLPVYKWTAQKYVRNAIAESFLDYVRKPAEEKVPALAGRGKRRAPSLEGALQPA